VPILVRQEAEAEVTGAFAIEGESVHAFYGIGGHEILQE